MSATRVTVSSTALRNMLRQGEPGAGDRQARRAGARRTRRDSRRGAAIVPRRTRARHRLSRGGRSPRKKRERRGRHAHRAPSAVLTRVHPGRREEPLERNGFVGLSGAEPRRATCLARLPGVRDPGDCVNAWNCCRRWSERRAVETRQRRPRRSERAAGVTLDIVVSSTCGGDGSDQPSARQPLQHLRVSPHDCHRSRRTALPKLTAKVTAYGAHADMIPGHRWNRNSQIL